MHDVTLCLVYFELLHQRIRTLYCQSVALQAVYPISRLSSSLTSLYSQQPSCHVRPSTVFVHLYTYTFPIPIRFYAQAAQISLLKEVSLVGSRRRFPWIRISGLLSLPAPSTIFSGSKIGVLRPPTEMEVFFLSGVYEFRVILWMLLFFFFLGFGCLKFRLWKWWRRVEIGGFWGGGRRPEGLPLPILRQRSWHRVPLRAPWRWAFAGVRQGHGMWRIGEQFRLFLW